ncbi:MAG: hypothetical protein JWR06_428, partial [Jatrophihabitans sp.]|nr:hypothetical protein [Jatrophihabitans sp.]
MMVGGSRGGVGVTEDKYLTK